MVTLHLHWNTEMLKVDRNGRRFERLEEPNLQGLQLSERYHLQAMICRSPDAFFDELGEKLLLLGEEVRPAEWVEDRIDLLALDPTGAAVVIELKRGSHKLQLLQALGYAGMIAKWESERLLACRHSSLGAEALEEEVENFLEEGTATLNHAQRVILIAESFDYEVLVTAEWLSEKYGVDIRCYRLSISADGTNEFISCSCIYPPEELAQHSIRRGRPPVKPVKWADWDEALRRVNNTAVVDFFRQELADGRDNYLRRRVIRYKVDGRRRWNVHARRERAYVWQNGRFSGDQSFWQAELGSDAEVQLVRNGSALRFLLNSPQQFTAFLNAITKKISNDQFMDNGQSVEVDAGEG